MKITNNITTHASPNNSTDCFLTYTLIFTHGGILITISFNIHKSIFKVNMLNLFHLTDTFKVFDVNHKYLYSSTQTMMYLQGT